MSRRALLRSSAVAAALGATGAARMGYADPAFAQPTDPGEDWVRVHLVVIDGLRPDEEAQMPTLRQLAADGCYLPDRAFVVDEANFPTPWLPVLRWGRSAGCCCHSPRTA